MQPAIAYHVVCFVGSVPVPLHNLWPSDHQLSLGSHRHIGDTVIKGNDLDVGIGPRRTYAAFLLCACHRIEIGNGRSLRQAEALGYVYPGQGFETLNDTDR